MFDQLCAAILLEAGYQIANRDMTNYYYHNRLGRAPLYTRKWYAQHAVIR